MRESRFLIIDSNPGNRQELAGLLSELGNVVDHSDNPDLIDLQDCWSDYDCVLLDRDTHKNNKCYSTPAGGPDPSPLVILTGPEDSSPPDGININNVDGYLPRNRSNVQLLARHLKNSIGHMVNERLGDSHSAFTPVPTLRDLTRFRDHYADAGIIIRTRTIPCDGPVEDIALAANCGHGRYSILIGDMTGSANLTDLAMMHLRPRISTYLMECTSPSSLLTELNREVLHNGDSVEFITAVALFVDLENKNISWSVAGHQTPLHRPWQSRRWKSLPGNGIPLGIRSGDHFKEHTLRMSPGDKILLLSDGILKMRGPIGGIKDWESAIGEFDMFPRDAAPIEIMEGIDDFIQSVTHGENVADEITAMLIQL